MIEQHVLVGTTSERPIRMPPGALLWRSSVSTSPETPCVRRVVDAWSLAPARTGARSGRSCSTGSVTSASRTLEATVTRLLALGANDSGRRCKRTTAPSTPSCAIRRARWSRCARFREGLVARPSPGTTITRAISIAHGLRTPEVFRVDERGDDRRRESPKVDTGCSRGTARASLVGSMANTARLPGVHPHWLYFLPTVAGIDGTIAKVRARGGEIIANQATLPNGDRIVPCHDPQGAAFGLCQSASRTSTSPRTRPASSGSQRRASGLHPSGQIPTDEEGDLALFSIRCVGHRSALRRFQWRTRPRDEPVFGARVHRNLRFFVADEPSCRGAGDPPYGPPGAPL